MKKRGFWLLEIIFVFLILAFIIFVSATPWLEFIFQTPSDINTLNLYSNGVNISFNISDVVGVNASSVKFYFKTNNSASDISYYVNGTPFIGFFNNSITNQSIISPTNWTTQLDDNDVYPAKFNINQDVMENTNHAIVPMGANGATKIEFLNVSNATQYNVFEFMANSSVAATSLFVFYCNSTYTTGTLATNTNCIQFGSIAGTPNFNISNSLLNSSKYQLIALTINTTTGKASNSVQITPTSYFVLDKIGGSATPWNVYNIPLGSRATTSQTSGNNGGAWTSQTYTVDAHLHQYQGTDTFYYYTSAGDTSGNNNLSLLRSDLLQQGGLSPSAPHVSIPANQSYAGFINISYLAAISPNGYSISFYNITLANTDESYNKTIVTNNSLNLSYYWNTSGTPDGSYLVKVVATDNISQTSFDFSENFIIDNTNPSISFSCAPLNVVSGDTITCSCSGTDATSGVASTVYTSSILTSSSGTYPTTCYVTDGAGNSVSNTINYNVQSKGFFSPSSSGGSSGSTGTSSPSTSATQNNISNSISVPENEIVKVNVGNTNYNLTILNVGNNSVQTIFSYDGIERTISVGGEINYTIGENIVTIKLQGIEKAGAIFNVEINKKSSPTLDIKTIGIIVGGIIILTLISLTLFRKHKKKKVKHAKKKRK
jgi:hypothetical protein